MQDQTIRTLIIMTAETLGYDPPEDWNEKAISDLEDTVDQYETFLTGELEDFVEAHPLRDGYTVEDLFEGGSAPYAVLMTLRGEGVGIWDGRWDHFFPQESIDALLGELEDSRFRFWADDTGTGLVNEALIECVHRHNPN